MTLRHTQPVRSAFRTHKSAAAVTMTVTSGQQRRRFPVITVKPDPAVLKVALSLARGDVSRLRWQLDGSCLVVNRGRQQ